MPNVSGIVFGAIHLNKSEIKGKRVLDVGACDFNGSIRPLIESWEPSEYIGVDIIEGARVDIVCSADDLLDKFGPESFDIVLSIEMLEHSRYWKHSIHNIKNICKTGGAILLTTRSYGYPCHGFPNDFWRFELEDMQQIFADFEISALESDPLDPGVFIKVKKLINLMEKDLADYELYSVLTNERIVTLHKGFENLYFRRLRLKEQIKQFRGSLNLKAGKLCSKILKL